MSRVMSFRDLRMIDELAQYNEIELLHPSMDNLVNGFLEQLGFDLSEGVLYVPNKHRDLQNKVAVGFRVVGRISLSREYLTSPLASAVDRLIAAQYTDPSLARELATMMGAGASFMAESSRDGLYDEDEEYPSDWIEDDMENIDSEIKALEAIRDSIRGPYLNAYGNIKTPAEYQSGDGRGL